MTHPSAQTNNRGIRSQTENLDTRLLLCFRLVTSRPSLDLDTPRVINMGHRRASRRKSRLNKKDEAFKQIRAIILKMPESFLPALWLYSSNAALKRLNKVKSNEEFRAVLVGLDLKNTDAVRQIAIRVYNSLQPIFRIPDEILSCIMELLTSFESGCMPLIDWRFGPGFEDRDGNNRSYFSSLRGFMSMNLSTRRIREVAINSPRCWRDVIISLTRGQSTTPDVLDTYLKRSKNLFFNLTIFVNVEDAAPNLRPLFTILRSHLHRCRRMEVCSGREPIQLHRVTQFIQDFGLATPALRSVKLADHTHSDNGLMRGITLIPFWDPAKTQIDSIDLEFRGCGQYIRRRPLLDDLHTLVERLRRLRISYGLEKSVVINIMRRCPRLEELEWESGKDEALSDQQPLELLSLKKFELRGKALNGGFPSLCAPGCEVASLGDVWNYDFPRWLLGSPSQAMQNFPALKRISIKSTGGYPTKLHHFLSSHPSLEEIVVHAYHPHYREAVQRGCDLLCGLSKSGKDSTTTTTKRSGFRSGGDSRPSGPLPSLRLLEYKLVALFPQRTRFPLAHTEAQRIFNRNVAMLADAIQHLLVCRPTLSITVLLQSWRFEKPKELVKLSAEFTGRFNILDDALYVLLRNGQLSIICIVRLTGPASSLSLAATNDDESAVDKHNAKLQISSLQDDIGSGGKRQVPDWISVSQPPAINTRLMRHITIYIDTLSGHSKRLQGATLSDLEQGIDQHVRGTLSA
ncbi:hypothetical protein DL93DRAFT_2153551 [Clavulina sp. PMI_390]|nr:hypothetical protein DL93DRAFT_2153551 [Clavulina sp. PMI_390]